MKACLFSFSGRKQPGNCCKTLDYIGEVLVNKGIEYSFFKIIDYEIKGCVNCNYECMFSKSCHYNDQAGFLYKTIADHDLVIIALPVYSGAPCSSFFAFNERSQSVFNDLDLYNKYSEVKKNYIIIGNEEAGGNDALNMVTAVEENIGEVLLLQSHEYGFNSISGKLIEAVEVKDKLKMYVEQILSRQFGNDR